MTYKRKMMSTLFVLVVSYLTYRIYRLEIYMWFCDQEQNQGACTVAGLLWKDQNHIVNSSKYLEKACQLDYPQGCYHLSLLYQDNAKEIEAKQALLKACKLGYKDACL